LFNYCTANSAMGKATIVYKTLGMTRPYNSSNSDHS